jgi:hypothetical protein
MSLIVSGVLFLITAVAVLVNPGLAPYLAAGYIFPLAVWLNEIRQKRRRSPRSSASAGVPARAYMSSASYIPSASIQRSVSFGVALLVLIAAAVIALLGNDSTYFSTEQKTEPSAGPFPIPISATYTARLRLEDSHSGVVSEDLAVPITKLNAVTVTHHGATNALKRVLASEGWERAVFSATHALEFTRQRRWPVQYSSLLPPQQSNKFPAPEIRVSLTAPKRRSPRAAVLELYFDGASKFILTAPKNAIGPTFPAGHSITVPGVGEQIRLALPEPDEPTLEFELRSSTFRSWPFTEILGATDAKLFGFLVAALGTLGSKRSRKKIRRWIAWLKKKLDKDTPRNSAGGPSSQRPSETAEDPVAS